MAKVPVNIEGNSYDMSHFVINTIISFISLTSNIWLWSIIKKRSQRLPMVKTILLFGCFIDILSSISALISSPVIVVGCNLFVVYFNTGIPFQGAKVGSILGVLMGFLLISSWISVLIKFLWRYHMLKYNKNPSGFFLLFILLLFGFCITVLGFGMILLFTFQKRNSQALALLDLNGFNPANSNKVVTVMTSGIELRYITVSLQLFAVVYIVIIVFFDRLINNIWKRQSVFITLSAFDMFLSIKKVFRRLALTPIISLLLPIYILYLNASDCSASSRLFIFTTLLFTSQPLLNAVITLYCVPPYKIHAKHIMGNINAVEPDMTVYTVDVKQNKKDRIDSIP